MYKNDEHKMIKALGIGVAAAAFYIWFSEEGNKRKVQNLLANIEEPLKDISPILGKYVLPETRDLIGS